MTRGNGLNFFLFLNGLGFEHFPDFGLHHTNKSTRVFKLLLVDEVLGEDVSSHAVGVTILQFQRIRFHELMQPGNAYLVHASDVPQGGSLAGGDDSGGGLVVLIQFHGYFITKDRLPKVDRGYAYRTHAKVTGHQLRFYGAMAHTRLLLGDRSQREEGVQPVKGAAGTSASSAASASTSRSDAESDTPNAEDEDAPNPDNPREWRYSYVQRLFASGTHYIVLREDHMMSSFESVGQLGFIFANGGQRSVELLRQTIQAGNVKMISRAAISLLLPGDHLATHSPDHPTTWPPGHLVT